MPILSWMTKLRPFLYALAALCFLLPTAVYGSFTPLTLPTLQNGSPNRAAIIILPKSNTPPQQQEDSQSAQSAASTANNLISQTLVVGLKGLHQNHQSNLVTRVNTLLGSNQINQILNQYETVTLAVTKLFTRTHEIELLLTGPSTEVDELNLKLLLLLKNNSDVIFAGPSTELQTI